MKPYTLSFLILLLCVGSMRVHSSSELNLAPTPFGDYLQESFDVYLAETKQWVKENRVFRSDDHELEVAINSPFERLPLKSETNETAKSRGILLVHGLSDSPYSFADIATDLSKQGLLVRTLLLPGHGAKPSDLMLPKIEDWMTMLSHHTNLLSKEVDEVWLGGFSTGANLALIEAIDNPDVAGTLLFSPAIVSRKPLDFLAPIAKYIKDWADIDPEENITRFDSLTMNGAALYYESSRMVRERLTDEGFDRPVFVTLSEMDSVVNGKAVYEYFNENFTHPHRKLMWFGEKQWDDERVRSYSMNIPQKRISTGSHMSVLYSPQNPLYGEQGTIRICNNGQSEAGEQACRAGAETWFSSFDYVERDKLHARLTWNPYFEETMAAISQVVGAK